MVKILKKMTKANSYNTCSQSETCDRKSNENADKICASERLEENKNFLSTSFKNSSDVIFYEFEGYSNVKALIVYIDGLVNKEVLNRDVVDSFIKKSKEVDLKENLKNPKVLKSLIHVANVQETKMLSEATDAILNGNTAMFFEGQAAFLLLTQRAGTKEQLLSLI